MRLKHFLSVFLTLLTLSIGQMWGADEVFYTLEPYATGSDATSTGYANAATATVDGISWKVTGNSNTVPWRIGGKGGSNSSSTSDYTRTVYSTTAIEENVTKIDITHGTSTLNALTTMTVTVSTAQNGGGTVRHTFTLNSSSTPKFEASKTITLERPNAEDWSNCYYLISYTVRAKGSSTQYLQFSQLDLYAAPAVAYTVTLKDDNSTLPEQSAGAGVTLPTRTGCTGYTFVGWTSSWTSNQTEWTQIAPTIIPSGSYSPTANVDLYPVYRKGTGTASATITTTLTEGKQYVFGAVKAAPSTTLANNTAIGAIGFTSVYSSTSWGQYTTYTPNTSGVITATINSANIWYLESISSGKYSFKNSNNASYPYIYLGTSTGQNQAGLNTSGQVYIEDVSSTCKDAFKLHPSSNGTNKLLLNTSSNYGYRMYGSNQSESASMCPYIRFYEYNVDYYYISVPNCCSPLGSINGSVNVTNSTPTGMELNWNNVTTGVSSWTVKYKTHNANEWQTYINAKTTSDASITVYSDGGTNNKCKCTIPTSCGTLYDFLIIANPVNGYCDNQEELNNNNQGYNSGKYAITKSGNPAGTVTGGTFITKIGQNTVTEACGDATITLAATPTTGYSFTSWSVTKTNGGAAVSVTSNQLTMPAEAVTVNATFTAQQYTITYRDKGNEDFSGAHESGYPTQHTYGTATTLKSASKTGYDFDGWFANENCTGSAVTTLGATAYTAGMTLYAKWTAKQYDIIYKDKNDAAFSGTHADGYPTQHTYGTATDLSTATKEGYTFGGWFTAQACTGSAVTTLEATDYTASPTVYALWNLETYTITYAGLSGASNTNPESYTIETATITLAAPGERSGYTFAGWTCGGNPITQIVVGSTGDKTITATWTANAHKVTYDPNGATSGDVPASPTEYNHGTKAEVLGNTGELAKTHYTFGGWSYGGNTYNAEDQVTVNENVTLSAVWNCAESVMVSKGEESHGTFTVSTGAIATCDDDMIVTVTSIAPADGYQFSAITQSGLNSGVTIDQDAKTVTYDRYASGSSEINVTFAAKSLSVTWNLNYEGAPSATVDNYTYGNSVTLPIPEREGYTLDGWYTTANDGSKIEDVGGDSNKPTEDKEYFAHWSPISCTVVWKVNGEAWEHGGSSSAYYDSQISDVPTPPTPGDGCSNSDRFMGWTATENYKGNSAPADLFNDVEHAPLIKANPTTYYAVFADYAE